MLNTMFTHIRHLVFLLLLFTVPSCASHPQPSDDWTEKGTENRTGPATTLSHDVHSGVPGQYQLGPGDELSIQVWRHDDLTRSVIIDPSGNIQYPLVGEMNITGLSLQEFNKKLADRLASYIKSPSLDISLLNVKNLNISVLGEVSNPGSYEWRAGMAIWDGIAKAGGFTADADLSKLLLVSPRKDTIMISTVNFHTVFQTGSSPRDFLLQNGDVIYVLPSTIADVQTFMNRITNIIAPIINIESGILLYPEVKDVLNGNTSSGTIIVPR